MSEAIEPIVMLDRLICDDPELGSESVNRMLRYVVKVEQQITTLQAEVEKLKKELYDCVMENNALKIRIKGAFKINHQEKKQRDRYKQALEEAIEKLYKATSLTTTPIFERNLVIELLNDFKKTLSGESEEVEK